MSIYSGKIILTLRKDVYIQATSYEEAREKMLDVYDNLPTHLYEKAEAEVIDVLCEKSTEEELKERGLLNGKEYTNE